MIKKKRRKSEFLPPWDSASSNKSRPITQEELAKHYGHKLKREPVVWRSEPPKDITGSVWQGKPSGIASWDNRMREKHRKQHDRNHFAKRPQRNSDTFQDKPKKPEYVHGKRPDQDRILYLAYGSNLHKRTMKLRCPGAIPRGGALIQDAHLVFRSVADVVPERGYCTPMGVWEISRANEQALDRYEGVSNGSYNKFYIPLPSKKNKDRKALIYLMNDNGVYPPSGHYASLIRAGYRNFGLDERYLDDAIRESFENKAPSHETKRRRHRQRTGDLQRMLVKMPEDLIASRREQIMLGGPEPTEAELKQIELENGHE